MENNHLPPGVQESPRVTRTTDSTSGFKRRFDGPSGPGTGHKRARFTPNAKVSSAWSGKGQKVTPVPLRWAESYEAFQVSAKAAAVDKAAITRMLLLFCSKNREVLALPSDAFVRAETFFFDELVGQYLHRVDLLDAKGLCNFAKSMDRLCSREFGSLQQQENAYLFLCRQILDDRHRFTGVFAINTLLLSLSEKLKRSPDLYWVDVCVPKALNRLIELLADGRWVKASPEELSRMHQTLTAALGQWGRSVGSSDDLRSIFRQSVSRLVSEGVDPYDAEQLSRVFRGFKLAMEITPPLIDAKAEQVAHAYGLLAHRLVDLQGAFTSNVLVGLLDCVGSGFAHGAFEANDTMASAAQANLLRMLHGAAQKGDKASALARKCIVLMDLGAWSPRPLAEVEPLLLPALKQLGKAVWSLTMDKRVWVAESIVLALTNLAQSRLQASSVLGKTVVGDLLEPIASLLLPLLKSTGISTGPALLQPGSKPWFDGLVRALQHLQWILGQEPGNRASMILREPIAALIDSLEAGIAAGWKESAITLVPSKGEAPLDQRTAVVNDRGRELRRVKVDATLYRNLFPESAPPVLLQASEMWRAQARQTNFCTVEGRLYRFDLVGRSRTSASDPGLCIGLPCDAAERLSNEWLHAEESYAHLLRAFLPELEMRQAEAPARSTQGRFALALISDADESELFALGEHAGLRTMQGIGFIREDLASALGLKPESAMSARKTRRLDPLALQHGPVSVKAQEKMVLQSLARASVSLNDAAKAWAQNGTTDLAQEQVVGGLAEAGLSCSQAIAVPVLGEQLWLSSHPAWQSHAAGVLLGQSPYDRPKLRAVDANEMRRSAVLKSPCAVDYTLTGYSNDEGTRTGHSFQGVLLVVARSQWPAQFADQQLLLSSSDQALCTAWKSAAARLEAHAESRSLTVDGTLVVLREHPHLVGVPIHWMRANLRGRYGKRVDLIETYQLPRLAKHLRQHPPITGATPPLLFTPARPLDLVARRSPSPSLDRWRAIASFYQSIPPAQRAPVNALLSTGHMLVQVLGEPAWKQQLLPSEISPQSDLVASVDAVLADRIARTEIALGLQIASNALVVSRESEARMQWRAKQLERLLKLRLDFDIDDANEGLRGQFERWSLHPVDIAVQMRALEDRAGLGRRRLFCAGMAAMSSQRRLEKLLSDACGANGLRRDAQLNDVVRDISLLPALRNDSYRRQKAAALARSMPFTKADAGLDPMRLCRLIGKISLRSPDYQAVLQALVLRTKAIAQDPFWQLPSHQLRGVLLAILSACVPELQRKPFDAFGLCELMNMLAASTACLSCCPLLGNWQTADPHLWPLALLELAGDLVRLPGPGVRGEVRLEGQPPVVVAGLCAAINQVVPHGLFDVLMRPADAVECNRHSASIWIAAHPRFRLQMETSTWPS